MDRLHNTNEAVLDGVKEIRITMKVIMNIKIKLIEHLLRHVVFIAKRTGDLNGKRTRGRPHKSFFKEIFQWMSFTL